MSKLKQILKVSLLLLFLLISFIYLIFDLNHTGYKFPSLAMFIFASAFGITSGLFIRHYGLLNYLKSLLPTAATLLATIWLLSSGYLSLVRENIEVEKRNLKSIRDSINIQKQKIDTLKIEIALLNLSLDSLKKQDIEKEEVITELYSRNEKLKINQDSIEKIYQNRLSKPILNRNTPILELVNFNIESNPRKIKISLYDKNMKRLDDSEFTLYYSAPSEYENKIEFNKNSGKYESYLIADESNVPNKESYYLALMIYKKGNEKPSWYPRLPYIDAEWQVILTDYPE